MKKISSQVALTDITDILFRKYFHIFHVWWPINFEAIIICYISFGFMGSSHVHSYLEKWELCDLITFSFYKPLNCDFKKVLNMWKFSNIHISVIMNFPRLKLYRESFLNESNKISINKRNQNLERSQPAPLLQILPLKSYTNIWIIR